MNPGSAPVKTDAQHAVVPEGGGEEVPVHAVLAVLAQGTVVQGDLPHPAPVSVAEGARSTARIARIRIFIVEDKATQNCINFKTTSLYLSTNTFQA